MHGVTDQLLQDKDVPCFSLLSGSDLRSRSGCISEVRPKSPGRITTMLVGYLLHHNPSLESGLTNKLPKQSSADRRLRGPGYLPPHLDRHALTEEDNLSLYKTIKGSLLFKYKQKKSHIQYELLDHLLQICLQHSQHW